MIFVFFYRNKCSQQDETLSCFNETQKYYGEKMIESICDYVTARLQFDRSTLNHPAWNYEQEARHNYAMNVDNSLFLVLDQSHFLDMMSSVEEQVIFQVQQ